MVKRTTKIRVMIIWMTMTGINKKRKDHSGISLTLQNFSCRMKIQNKDTK